jgi:CRISPR-associated protein Csd2
MNIPKQICDPGKRYDFLLLFDVQDGNPNGDPDAGNLPRLDPETMQGIVTDVCLKRKIRNYVDLTGEVNPSNAAETDSEGRPIADNGIFVRDSGIALNTKLEAAAVAVGAPKDKKKESKKGREEMCRRYFDVRMFGGVLSTGEYNCGQVRGPMQLTFARSIDAIIPGDISITRVAITKEGEQKETEMGRKSQVPYGLYLGKGFYSPMLGDASRGGTGVSEADLRLFWRALCDMFEHDRSAARGFMEVCGIYVFRHDNPLGNAHAGSLFARLSVARNADVEAPRAFTDYTVSLDAGGLPEGVTLTRLVG